MSNVQMEQLKSSLKSPVNQDIRIDAHDLTENFSNENQNVYHDWLSLLKADGHSSILENPDFVLQDLNSPDQWGTLKPILFLAYQNKKPIACAVIIPKSVRASHLQGWKSRKNILGYRLAGNQISGDKSIEIQNILFQAILNHRDQTGANFLLIDDLESDSALNQIKNQPEFSGLKTISPSGLQDHHWLIFPESAEEYWGGFKSKTRNTLRRKMKKMGDIEFIPITEHEQIADFLKQANIVSLNTWQSQELGLRVHNNDEEKKFLKYLAFQGSLRAYLLKKDSKPVAFIIGTQFNGTYYLDELGFDRQYSRLSPGTVLFHLLVNDLLENKKPEVLDFGLGDAEYKKLFGNQVSQSQLLYILSPGWTSNLTFMKYHFYNFLKTGFKSTISRLGAWKNFRRKIKDRVIKNRSN